MLNVYAVIHAMSLGYSPNRCSPRCVTNSIKGWLGPCSSSTTRPGTTTEDLRKSLVSEAARAAQINRAIPITTPRKHLNMVVGTLRDKLKNGCIGETA